MLEYPVWFPPVRYNGANAKKRAKAAEQNRLIRTVSNYVNDVGRKRPEPIHRYLYSDIAREFRLDPAEVRALCMVDGGHHGFMVLRPGLSLDQAVAEAGAQAAINTESPSRTPRSDNP